MTDLEARVKALQNLEERAKALRVRVFKIFGYGGVARVADEMGWTRSFTSRLLNGRVDNPAAYEAVEALLDEHDEPKAA